MQIGKPENGKRDYAFGAPPFLVCHDPWMSGGVVAVPRPAPGRCTFCGGEVDVSFSSELHFEASRTSGVMLQRRRFTVKAPCCGECWRYFWTSLLKRMVVFSVSLLATCGVFLCIFGRDARSFLGLPAGMMVGVVAAVLLEPVWKYSGERYSRNALVASANEQGYGLRRAGFVSFGNLKAVVRGLFGRR